MSCWPWAKRSQGTRSTARVAGAALCGGEAKPLDQTAARFPLVRLESIVTQRLQVRSGSPLLVSEFLFVALESEWVEDLATPQLLGLEFRETSFVGALFPLRPNDV